MKNIKNIVIGIFAVIGFTAIVTGFTNEAEQEPNFGTPESHVWEMHLTSNSTNSYVFSINKVTGEVRKFNSTYSGIEKIKPMKFDPEGNFNLYRVAEKK